MLPVILSVKHFLRSTSTFAYGQNSSMPPQKPFWGEVDNTREPITLITLCSERLAVWCLASTRSMSRLRSRHQKAEWNSFPDFQDPYYRKTHYDGLSLIGFSFSTNSVELLEEVLVYPFESFLAEVGGALGLFLGFSFMMIWDILLFGFKLLKSLEIRIKS